MGDEEKYCAKTKEYLTRTISLFPRNYYEKLFRLPGSGSLSTSAARKVGTLFFFKTSSGYDHNLQKSSHHNHNPQWCFHHYHILFPLPSHIL